MYVVRCNCRSEQFGFHRTEDEHVTTTWSFVPSCPSVLLSCLDFKSILKHSKCIEYSIELAIFLSPYHLATVQADPVSHVGHVNRSRQEQIPSRTGTS